jgi:hypothetical protein
MSTELMSAACGNLIRSAVWWLAEYVRTDDPVHLESARSFLREVLNQGGDHRAQDVAVTLYDTASYLEGSPRRLVVPR